MPLPRLLPTLTLLLGTALAAPLQYAEIVGAKAQGNMVTLNLNYVDVFFAEPADAAKVIKLGDYKTAQEFYDANPSGIYIRDVNPKLRTLKTDAKTVFNLVCLKNEGGLQRVSQADFLRALNGKNTLPCRWPFYGLVFMKLEGTRILEISQQYLP